MEHFEFNGSKEQGNLALTASFSLTNLSITVFCLPNADRSNATISVYRVSDDAVLQSTKPELNESYAIYMEKQNLKTKLGFQIKANERVELRGIVEHEKFDLYRLPNGLPNGSFDVEHALYTTGFLTVYNCENLTGQIILGDGEIYLETNRSPPFRLKQK